MDGLELTSKLVEPPLDRAPAFPEDVPQVAWRSSCGDPHWNTQGHCARRLVASSVEVNSRTTLLGSISGRVILVMRFPFPCSEEDTHQ